MRSPQLPQVPSTWCTDIYSIYIPPTSSTETSNLAIYWSTLTASSRFATLAWRGGINLQQKMRSS